MSVYCCTGSREHWYQSAARFDQVARKVGEDDLSSENFGLWGTSRENRHWFSAERGDRIICYAKQPVGGIIGVGEIYKKKSMNSREFIWQDEWENSSVIYHNLIVFEKLGFLPYEMWGTDNLDLSNRGVTAAGIKRMHGDNAELIDLRPKVRDKWNVRLVP